MSNMTIMSDRANNPKLTSRTPASFKEEVEDLKTMLQRQRRWFYRGEKISLEGIINVAVLEFLRMSPEARERIIQPRIDELEAMFEAESPDARDQEPDVYPGEQRKSPRPKKGGAA